MAIRAVAAPGAYMDTGIEPARARSKIGLMQKRAKARSDTGAKRSQVRWGGNYCADCGARCMKPSTVCPECRGPIPYIPKKWTPTTEYRDLLSDETRKRLERLERREPLDG